MSDPSTTSFTRGTQSCKKMQVVFSPCGLTESEMTLAFVWNLFFIFSFDFFFLVDCFGGFFSCSLSRLLQHIQGPLFSSYLNWALLLGWQSVRLQPSPQAECLDLS